MEYPTLYVKDRSRQMVDDFGGYNHNMRIGENEFYNMKNMTSDHYPVLAPRKNRGVYKDGVQANAIIAKDKLCYVDGSAFVIGNDRIEMGLTDESKTLVSMGAYVIILPDKKYINTADITEFGNIEARFTSSEDVSFTLCKIDGSNYTAEFIQDDEPSEPQNMALWIDTSSTPHTLKQWSATSGMWVSIATTYIKISSPGIGAAFEQYDGVTISGVIAEELQDLNATMVVWDRADDYIVVVGVIDNVMGQTVEEGKITVTRQMPNMDFVVESENRLWGCRYGVATNGEVVNEVYASKLGDFKNWNCFMGISTDSYAASVGTDGQFTGAITMPGYVLFFKEGCIHKVYGNYPANFQIQTTICRGVQRGCERSLAVVNEIIYYKARHAICAYDGSLPTEISAPLGEMRYNNAVAGAHGNKYYISMEDTDGNYHLFVYDTAKGMWHKEDDLRADCFCSCREELYCIDHNSKKIITMFGSGTADAGQVAWMAQTGIIGTDMPDMKYISRLIIRMSMEIGAKVRFLVQYDSMGGWEQIGAMSSTSLRSVSVPIKPRRCDHFRLRIEGTGEARIYSITQTQEKGSDIS